jgi:hypothetical protein
MEIQMNEVVKWKWIDALRSDAYKQGKGGLENVDEDGNLTFCCLGILCDLGSKENIPNNSGIFPTAEIYHWSELEYDQAIFLSKLNDTVGLSFDEIADVIENDFRYMK